MKLRDKISSITANDRIVLKNTFFAFVVKGGSLIISLLMTPAFIKYFNDNAVLGVWYTLLSVLIWFLNFDMGIGNGIRNNLVKDFASNDYKSAQKTISSGLVSNIAVTIVLSIIGITLILNTNLNWLYNIDDGVVSYKSLLLSTIFVFSAIMLRFMLTTIGSIFYAIQKSAINSFLALCVSILQLGFVLVFRFSTPEEALIGLSLAYLGISNIPVIIAGVVVFLTKLKQCRPSIKAVKKENIKSVLGIGFTFFLCQILYMCIVNTNELLITNIYGPESTTNYTFYYKITSLISMVVTLAMTPIWSIITKAMAEKDYIWLNKLYKKVKLFGLLAIVVQFLFIPFQQIFFNIWLRENTITVDYSIAIAFACFGGAFVYSGILSTIVCGMARMKLQAICYTVGVLLKFALIFIFYNSFGNWSIVVWGNVLVLAPYCIIQHIDLNRYIKSLTKQKTEDIK